MRTRFCPKSTCIWCPGAVSYRTVANCSARSSRRRGATTFCTTRSVAATPRSRSSCVTTTALCSAGPSNSRRASARAGRSKRGSRSGRGRASSMPRTKGKTESGVKYVKRNALAGRSFPSFAALGAHLVQWMREADQRVHGTTFEVPRVRFEREEGARLRPLPARTLVVRERRLRRRVALDALVDVDTVRYSVPHQLVRAHVEVHVGDHAVSIYHGPHLIATHARRWEPHTHVIEATHFHGLWRQPPRELEEPTTPAGSPLAALGRSLHDYAVAVAEVGG